jgi:polyhydroxyalkanoate synthesis regulator phasin
MATRSGRSGSKKSTGGSGGGGSRKRSAASSKRSAASSKRSAASSKRSAASSKRRARSARTDKSVEAFRNSLERSLMLSRDRLQEVVDDAVRRGRMTRGDANELVSKLVSRGRKQRDEVLRDLERLLDQARRGVETRTGPARRQATRTAGRAARAARDVADPALAEADKLRRRAGVGATSPITAYDQLTAPQVKARLRDLSPAELRKVRTQEQRGKARKGVLDEVERLLAKK